jgi:hypothetical protein
MINRSRIEPGPTHIIILHLLPPAFCPTLPETRALTLNLESTEWHTQNQNNPESEIWIITKKNKAFSPFEPRVLRKAHFTVRETKRRPGLLLPPFPSPILTFT